MVSGPETEKWDPPQPKGESNTNASVGEGSFYLSAVMELGT